MNVSGLITKETIKKNLIRNRKLLEQYNVMKIGIFGSYVREEPTEISDIDLLIETEKGMDLMSIVDLENETV
ncbi:MAG: nucleotidyltransferase family protein [Candidatus Scalinduaceae bacterium]